MLKPSKPCYSCSVEDWRETPAGSWVCGRCHPLPKEAYSPDVIALRDRVINGNDKLFIALQQIKKLVHDTEEWSRQMDRLSEGAKKLRGLCSELKLLGFEDCLYLNDSGKKVRGCLENPDGFWCQVCPSKKPYWGPELMALPGHKKSRTKPENEGQKEFLETLGREA